MHACPNTVPSINVISKYLNIVRHALEKTSTEKLIAFTLKLFLLNLHASRKINSREELHCSAGGILLSSGLKSILGKYDCKHSNTKCTYFRPILCVASMLSS